MPGPQPTPTETLKLRGSWRADVRDGEPQPERGMPGAPAWLCDAGLELWEYYVNQLDGAGLMTKLDRDMLGSFCQSMVDYVQAVEAVRRDGVTVETDKGNVIQHPAVGVKNKALDKVRMLGAMFGLSPSARVGLVAPKGDEGKGKAAKYFSKSG